MSSARKMDAPSEARHLVEHIEEINEDIYHKRDNRIESVKTHLTEIQKILRDQPELMFEKVNVVKLTGTWKYCIHISPIEYALLQNNESTWQCMMNMATTDKLKVQLSKAWDELQNRKIEALDYEKFYLNYADVILAYSKHLDYSEFAVSALALAPPQKMELDLKQIKVLQYRKDHPEPSALVSARNWLVGNNPFEIFYQKWCESVMQAIGRPELKNVEQIKLSPKN